MCICLGNLGHRDAIVPQFFPVGICYRLLLPVLLCMMFGFLLVFYIVKVVDDLDAPLVALR